MLTVCQGTIECSQQLHEVSIILIPIVQMTKLIGTEKLSDLPKDTYLVRGTGIRTQRIWLQSLCF